jgi:hypothetical protein
MPRKKPRPAEAPSVAPQRPVARPDRGRGPQGAAASRRTHDARGKFTKANGLGGRPPGSKDKRPRAGTLRAVYGDLIEHGQGHAMMLAAVTRGVKATPAIAVKYLELGAKVLDKAEDVEASRHVHFHLHTNVDFPEPAWSVGGRPALARRAENNGDNRVAR